MRSGWPKLANRWRSQRGIYYLLGHSSAYLGRDRLHGSNAEVLHSEGTKSARDKNECSYHSYRMLLVRAEAVSGDAGGIRH